MNKQVVTEAMTKLLMEQSPLLLPQAAETKAKRLMAHYDLIKLAELRVLDSQR